MAKLSKKEMERLQIHMGISKADHSRPPIGRPTVFYGMTNKQRRKEGKRLCREFF